MSDFRDFLLAAVVGLFAGFSLAAWAQGKIDDRAFNSGYIVLREKAFQLVPAPTNPSSRSEG